MKTTDGKIKQLTKTNKKFIGSKTITKSIALPEEIFWSLKEDSAKKRKVYQTYLEDILIDYYKKNLE